MKVMLHPHKGYFNTEFHIFAEGGTQKYTIHRKGDETGESVLYGLVNANIPHSFKLSQPGEFTVEFEDGTKSDIIIEDGYKFGGSRLKTAFIFDNCPWVFVIMHDRTYFYNRDTEESYVEPISPDNIIEVSKDFVIFENFGESEQSLFSLAEQKPILCIQNIVTFNDEILVWAERLEEKNNEYIVKIYSLTSKEVTTNIHTSSYCVDEKCRNLFFVDGKKVKSHPLSFQGGTAPISFEYDGSFAAFIDGQIAVSQVKCQSVIFIYNLSTGEKIGSIEYTGVLAELNGTVFADINKQREAIYTFNMEDGGFHDCKIEGEFSKLHLYPCTWNVFYVLTTIDIFKSKIRYSCETRSYLKSMRNPKLNITLKDGAGHFYSQGEAICFYNYRESFVTSKNFSGSGYSDSGNVYVSKSGVIKQDDNAYTVLSKNGYWDHRKEDDIDFSYYEDFGIIKEKSTGLCKTLYGRELGKMSCINKQYKPYIATDSCRIYKGGLFLKSKKYPKFISPRLKYGLDIDQNGVIIYQYSSGYDILEKRILEDIFDTSKYHDVLLSESGEEILYRTADGASVMNVKTGETHTYDNLSYVKHTNGIRPLFSTPASLQPRIVNPVTGQIVDYEELTKLQFVSPDGKLYADTRLDEYVEYHSYDTELAITTKEYKSLYNKYQYPRNEKRGSENWEKVKQDRIDFVLEHFDFLNQNYPKLFHNTKDSSRWAPIVLDEENTFGTAHFLARVFEARGVAVIRNSRDDSEYCRIPLGAPLTFLNYVAFSYDARYVSIAGFRESKGGVFIVFDLVKGNVVTHQDTGRAVWATGFSKKGALAAYTSDPYTIFSKSPSDYAWDEDHIIDDRNYLTFSADGNYFALSNQGYISKYDRDGNITSGWGHQPSSMVSIRSSEDPFEEICQFNDLSDGGIMNSSQRSTVASVSFSKGNTSLLMVGKDGVVIIRNLHLDSYADK